MRKLLFTFCIALLSIVSVNAQTTFFNLYGSPSGEEGNRVINVPGGGYLVAGSTDAAGYGWRDIAVWRISATGSVTWCRKLGTSNQEWIADIVAIPTGGFYVAMSYSDPWWVNPQYTQSLVTKLDANGNMLWTQRYSSSTHCAVVDILPTASGGFVFLAVEDSVNQYSARVKVVSCNSSGAITWSKKFMTEGMWTYNNLAQCTNGDITVAVTTHDQTTNQYLTLLRINSSGNLVWSTRSPIPQNEYVYKIACSGNEFYVLAGITDTTKLYKFGSTGNCIWTRNIITPFVSYNGLDQITYSNGKICLTGWTFDQAGYYEGTIAEFDTAGTLLQSGFLYTGVFTQLYDATYNPTGDIVLTGSVWTGFGPSDTLSMYLAVGDLVTGNICGYTSIPFSVTIGSPLVSSNFTLISTTTGTSSPFTMLTSTGSLIQIGCIVGIEEEATVAVNLFPNPANEVLTIETSAEQSTIHLYNSLGQCVLTEQLSGVRNELSVAELAEGVYIYQVVAESGEVFSGKLVID